MSPIPQSHYLNADFDLGLRPRALWQKRSSLVRQIRDLSVQALLGAAENDIALIHSSVPDEFLNYLHEHGVPVPTILTPPQMDPESMLRPFGWSAEAMEMNQGHRRPVDHSPLATIERVNARRFAQELETALYPEGPVGEVMDSIEALERFLSHAPEDSEWVIKADHGNAGLANRRLRQPRLRDEDRTFLTNVFAEDDHLVVEPWLQRERDWCIVFEAPIVSSTLRIHEMINTRDGALVGAMFQPLEVHRVPRSDELISMAQNVAGALGREDYRGPVCVDAFEWRDGDRLSLRPLVDLNCRHSMSDGAYRLWRRIAPARTLYYRFFSRSKLTLPKGLSPATVELAEHKYNRSQRRGILFASPIPSSSPGEYVPNKLAVIFVGEDRAETLFLEHWFRSRFES